MKQIFLIILFVKAIIAIDAQTTFNHRYDFDYPAAVTMNSTTSKKHQMADLSSAASHEIVP